MLQTINGTLRQTNLPNESEEYLSRREGFITRIPVIHGCRAKSKNAASTSWYRSGISSISRDKAEENSMRSSSIRRLRSGLINEEH